jgi:hypothetical protein
LNPAQMVALKLIEQCQASLAIARETIAQMEQGGAAHVITKGLEELEVKKIAWLRSTQSMVQPVAVMPEKLQLVAP